MYIEQILTISNGWTILNDGKVNELTEALVALRGLDEELIVNILSKDNDSYGLYINLLGSFSELLSNALQWTDTVPAVGTQTLKPFNFTPIKNGVLASLVGLDDLSGGEFSAAIYRNAPYYYNAGLADVSLLFVPTKQTINRFIELGADLERIPYIPNEETCRAELTKFMALTSQAPIVVAFFSFTESESIIVEEVSIPKVGDSIIERTIEFAPEFYQAGVGLLSYFGEVLRQKDPNIKAKVRIEQDGRKVRLHIESPGGDIETVEKELDQYALVISNQAPPETLFEQRMHIMQLESRLEVAKVEIKNAHDLKQLTEGFYSQQVRDLKQQVDSLTQQVAAGLLQQHKVFDLMQQQSGSHERMQMAMLAHGQMLFKDLLTEATGNQRLTEAISSLQHSLLSGIALIDVEDKLEQALSTIKQTKPGFLPRILTELEGATYKAAASGTIGAVVTWLTQHAQ